MSEGGESPDLRLLRLVPQNGSYFSEGMPTRMMFEPSPADEQHDPVRVSVWNYAIVNTARAQALRADGKPREGWSVQRVDVAAVSAEATRSGRPALAVVADPDGADGAGITDEERLAHHGIEGLSVKGAERGPAKHLRKAVLAALAAKASGPHP